MRPLFFYFYYCISLNFQIKKQGFDTEPVITKISDLSNTIAEIKKFMTETEMLREDIERELKIKQVAIEEIEFIKSDIQIIEQALKEIKFACENEQKPAEKFKVRLDRFISDLLNDKSDFYKALNMIRRGENYRLNIINSYKKIEISLAD